MNAGAFHHAENLSLRVPCDTCGARPGARCATSSNEILWQSHARRRRRALRIVDANARGEVASRADLIAVLDGAACAQEIARDTWRSSVDVAWNPPPRVAQAWRVAVTCACLSRVVGSRGAAVAARILDRWPRPVLMLTAPPLALLAELTPLGLRTVRRAQIAEASERALTNPGALSDGESYAAQSIRLVVDGVTSFEPDDKILRAVRARMLRGDPT